jgi:hypothetical protein
VAGRGSLSGAPRADFCVQDDLQTTKRNEIEEKLTWALAVRNKCKARGRDRAAT